MALNRWKSRKETNHNILVVSGMSVYLFLFCPMPSTLAPA